MENRREVNMIEENVRMHQERFERSMHKAMQNFAIVMVVGDFLAVVAIGFCAATGWLGL